MSAQVRIDGVELEMDTKDLPGFTLQISDPFQPGTIKGTKSTQFRIPATNKAKRTLGSEVMNQAVPTEPSSITIGSYGQVYLKNRIKVIERDRDEIRAVTYGNNAAWSNILKDIELRELDLGESRRLITADDMIATWEDEDALVYWPLINYGAITDSFTSSTDIAPSLLRPSIRCHKVLEKALSDNGFTIKFHGSAESRWKKYHMPLHSTVLGGWDFNDRDQRNARVLNSGVLSYTLTNTPAPNVLAYVGSEIDPSSVLASGIYTNGSSDRLMDIGYRDVWLSFDPFDPSWVGTELTFVLWDQTAGEALATTNVGSVDTTEDPIFSGGWTNILVPAGHSIYIGVMASYAGLAPVNLNVGGYLYFGAIRNDYEYGQPFNIASVLPKMTALELFKAMCAHMKAEVWTDDSYNTIHLSRYKEFYKPHVSAGKSLVGREDHSEAPVKHTPLKASRIDFTYEDDENDYDLEQLNISMVGRKYGDGSYEVEGGILEPISVEMPFAATAMQYAASLFIPAMREHDGSTNGQRFDWVPRLLMSNGTSRSEWTFDGVLREAYPRAFFLHTDEEALSMSFSKETAYQSAAPGAIELDWSPFLRRYANSSSLEIDLWLRDYELARFDFGVPYAVHDGNATGWYYFTKIEQKKFGVEEPTRCTLIQV